MSKPNRAVSTQEIDDVNIAAAMFSLGFKQSHKAKQIQKRNGKVKFIYFFEPSSPCGRYKLNECLEAWTDENFIEENPFHELAIMMAFNANRDQMLQEIHAKQGMLTEISHDGSDALINLAAPVAELQKLFS